MIKNYLKIAFRSLWRSKAHSLINVFGLGLGIASCILIVLYVKDEWTYDHFHLKSDRIFRAYAIEDFGENQQFFDTTTPFPMGPALKNNFAEVVAMVRISPINTQVRIGDALFSEEAMIAGTEIFKIFDFDILNGDETKVLDDQLSVLITESMAKKLFGELDALERSSLFKLGRSSKILQSRLFWKKFLQIQASGLT